MHEARAQYDSARANTILRRNALDDAYEALAEITGQTVRNLKGLPDDFRPDCPPNSDADAGWRSPSATTRPAGAGDEVAVGREDVGTARAGHLPTLSVSGSYGEDGVWGDRADLLNNSTIAIGNASHRPEVGLTLSRADLLRLRHPVARAPGPRHPRRPSPTQLEQQKRAIVRTTRNAYQTLRRRHQPKSRRVAWRWSPRAAAYEASQVGLEVGTRTILDVLITQQQLFQAQREYARAQYAFLQNLLRLDRPPAPWTAPTCRT